MEFALIELPAGRGFALCDAKTGEILPGQKSCVVESSTLELSRTEVVLVFHSLPLFKG